jgi:putative transposase
VRLPAEKSSARKQWHWPEYAIEAADAVVFVVDSTVGVTDTDEAVVKLLWLAIRDIEDKRARQRAKEAGKPRGQRKAPGRLVEGATVHGWKAALNALAIAYPNRLNHHIN